ncbi:hypothetical protein [Planococcus sp. NCCP-2050]|uniref:hypothetical protein n=1 Tax=Planococcus sp. NCCP-2050 TaxID=2944679 RepID=UPI0020402E48|nr:hypothetical protein [Planococcus sp. NCCP-2050]GKW46937.1 hypothetical protein NCCP2050_26290 [Planococcus sp. NCCP-2050]
MKTKGIVGLILITLLISGCFFYKWQQQANILEEKLYELTDDVIFGLHYFTESDLNFSEDAILMHSRLMNAAYAVEYTRKMHDADADTPLESTEADYLFVFHDLLKSKYLPVAESIKYAEGETSAADKEKIRELSTNLKEAGFLQDPISMIGWSEYIQAVEEFLRLEGRITDDDALVM